MPFTATELAEWVNGLGLSEDKKKVVLESFGAPEVLTKVGETVLMRSDYSRQMDALKAEQKKLEDEHKARVAKEDSFHGELQAWKDGKEKEFKEAVAAREASEARLTAVQAKVKELAPTYGIPDDQLSTIMTPLEKTASPTVKTGDQPRDAEGKYVPKDEFNKIVTDYAKLPAIITVLEREHIRLFGPNAEMPDWIAMVEAGKPLRTQWEEKYKVNERRQALAKEQHDREIKEAEERGAQSARSKLLAENPDLGRTVRRDSEQGSPIFKVAHNQQIPDNDKRTDEKSPQRGVAAAVQAFREKKYSETAA